MEVQASKHDMVRLDCKQMQSKLNFIHNYNRARNAADGSVFDPNSNVTNKNIATMMAELNKDINIQVKRKLVYDQILKHFGVDVAALYLEQLENHDIYCHDETFIAPYCAAISVYPFLSNGLQDFGGESRAPQHLSSFNGGFINLIFALSSQFCGAIATVEYLMCFDYFAKKDYGEDYLDTHRDVIQQELQQVVYALNQPASARNFQSVFWNISVFDKHYFKALFEHFRFPDDSKPSWKSLDKLQKFFMQWFNQERTKALLTFPVVTVAMLNDTQEILDKDYEQFVAQEISRGNSFFIYTSDTVDSLSSCCRLRNDISDQLNDFSYSLGAGGVMTGSINVITLNMNRFIQKLLPDFDKYYNGTQPTWTSVIHTPLQVQIKLMHKYQVATRYLFEGMKNDGLLPAYKANFITFDKQYLTIGINGLMESAEYLGLTPDDNASYTEYISFILKTVSDTNKESAKQYGMKFNTELVPAENLGVKFARWDKIDNLFVPRNCYNSYLYPVENDSITVISKFKLHGNATTRFLDGGSALHLNLEEIPTEQSARQLLQIAVMTGCNYFCFNVKVTVCNNCKYIHKQTMNHCVKCGSKNVDYATRVIGYLRRVTNFSKERQEEEHRRHYHRK